jgi:F-type H+-transporting ATPase subunit a
MNNYISNDILTVKTVGGPYNIDNSSPLDQFDIRDLLSLDILGNVNISLTNIGLYLTISSLIILILYLISNNYNKVISNN